MTQNTTITEDEFYEKYRPLKTEHGDLKTYCRHNDADRPIIQQALAERRLWTMHHGDYDSVYFWNGFHFVNTLDYVICEVPYDEGDDLIAIDADAPICTECVSCGMFYEDITEARYDRLNSGAPCGAEGCTGDPELYDPDDDEPAEA